MYWKILQGSGYVMLDSVCFSHSIYTLIEKKRRTLATIPKKNVLCIFDAMDLTSRSNME